MAHKSSKKKLQFLKRNTVSEEVRQSFNPVVNTDLIDNAQPVEEPKVFESAPVYPEEPVVTAQNFDQPVVFQDRVINASFDQPVDEKPQEDFNPVEG